MFVKLKDYSVSWSLWPFVCHWGIISTSKISTAFFKKYSSEPTSSDTFLVGLRLFPQDIFLNSTTTLEFFSGISLKPDTFEVGEGGGTRRPAPWANRFLFILYQSAQVIMHHFLSG
jgi:hypothetical protein